MEQAQGCVECGENISPRGERDFAIGRGQLRLDPLDVPIAEIAPEKLVGCLAGFVKTEMLESILNLRGDGRQPRKNPAVRERAFARHGIWRLGTNFGGG